MDQGKCRARTCEVEAATKGRRRRRRERRPRGGAESSISLDEGVDGPLTVPTCVCFIVKKGQLFHRLNYRRLRAQSGQVDRFMGPIIESVRPN